MTGGHPHTRKPPKPSSNPKENSSSCPFLAPRRLHPPATIAATSRVTPVLQHLGNWIPKLTIVNREGKWREKWRENGDKAKDKPRQTHREMGRKSCRKTQAIRFVISLKKHVNESFCYLEISVLKKSINGTCQEVAGQWQGYHIDKAREMGIFT